MSHICPKCKQAACEAVADLWIKINSDEGDDPSLLEVQAAIRALTAPEPVGEEELVVEIAEAAHWEYESWWDSSRKKHSMMLENRDEEDRDTWTRTARAALDIVNAHRSREADHYKSALRWMGDQPCQRHAEGSAPDCDCTETEACATEWCLPCYARATLAEVAQGEELQSDRREADELRRELTDHLEGTEGVRRAIVKADDELREVREVLREVLGCTAHSALNGDVSVRGVVATHDAMNGTNTLDRADEAAKVKP